MEWLIDRLLKYENVIPEPEEEPEDLDEEDE